MCLFCKVVIMASAGSLFVGMLAAMGFTNGYISINTYGEGWYEVVIAGMVWLLTMQEVKHELK